MNIQILKIIIIKIIFLNIVYLKTKLRIKDMKKTLALSLVVSTFIFAGGDIAPVEPAVVTPAPQAPAPAASNWKFSGQGVLYYQTRDYWGQGSLFDQGPNSATGGSSQANVGLSLKAENSDLIGGIGFGAELIGLGTLGLEEDVVSGVLARPSEGEMNGGAINQLYLTYGLNNTKFKVGRQELPLALSPLAYSEGWNLFKNTFEALTIVNTDIANTTLVGAWVRSGNGFVNTANPDISHGNFVKLNGNDGVYMLTAQNKSIDGLTLTGSLYHAPDMLVTDDVNAGWLDAAFKIGSFNAALQGGIIESSAFTNDTTAYGAKIGGTFGDIDASLAFSSVNDGDLGVKELGAKVKTPLYTQMILNQDAIYKDSDTVVARASMKALGGKIALEYDYSDLGSTATKSTFGTLGGAGTYQEADLIYTTNITKDLSVFAAYVYQHDDRVVAPADNSQNFIRAWARYNF
jgi:hypothetical protein